MFGFILRKVLYALLIVFGVALITFLLFHVAGPDPAISLVGKYATAQEIARVKAQYGLDLPLHLQFLNFLKQIITFDFERSFYTKQTIITMIKDGVLISLSVTLPAFIISSLLSIGLAMVCALKRNSLIDQSIVVLSVMGMSISSLAYILFGQYFIAFELGQWLSSKNISWLAISGFEKDFPNVLRYLILPWIIWIALSVGVDVRFFRTVFLEELGQDYVRTAYAKGASTKIVMLKHVLPNALIPIITRLVISVPFLLMGSLLLENFFSIPGIGNLAVESFNNADWPVIKAVTFLGSVLYIMGNLVSDILYALVDPRIKLQ